MPHFMIPKISLSFMMASSQNAPDFNSPFFQVVQSITCCRDIALIWTMKLCASSHFTGRPAGEYKENAFYQLYTMMSELFTEFSRY